MEGWERGIGADTDVGASGMGLRSWGSGTKTSVQLCTEKECRV